MNIWTCKFDFRDEQLYKDDMKKSNEALNKQLHDYPVIIVTPSSDSQKFFDQGYLIDSKSVTETADLINDKLS